MIVHVVLRDFDPHLKDNIRKRQYSEKVKASVKMSAVIF